MFRGWGRRMGDLWQGNYATDSRAEHAPHDVAIPHYNALPRHPAYLETATQSLSNIYHTATIRQIVHNVFLSRLRPQKR